VIVTGDFFQLPPVTKGKPLKFAFEAEMWSETIKHSIKLTKVFRQKDQGTLMGGLQNLHLPMSSEFVDMLNEMRYGKLSQKSVQRFRALSRDIVYEDGIGPTELYVRIYENRSLSHAERRSTASRVATTSSPPTGCA
jgi:ATP-dependent DNA helicase PIF1